MKLEGFAYDVSARVTFSRAEIDALVKLSGYHYDAECVAAGMYIGAQHPNAGTAERNGFIAVVALHDGDELRAVWPFRNFDIALKILERRSAAPTMVRERVLLDALDKRMRAACDAIQREHERLASRVQGVQNKGVRSAK